MKQTKTYSNLYKFLIISVLSLSFLVYFSSYSFGNYRFFSVQSGSMEPVLKKGDLILSQKQDYYTINSVITLNRESDIPLTHRLVAIENIDGTNATIYRTKGDKNDFTDSEYFTQNDIIGKMILKFGLLGTLVDFLKTDLGLGLFIVIPTVFVILKELKSIKNEVQKAGKIRFK